MRLFYYDKGGRSATWSATAEAYDTSLLLEAVRKFSPVESFSFIQ